MEIRYFAHSWLSDWNHGNAHFLRGLARALLRRGHQVRVYEGVDHAGGGWSLNQLWSEPGGAAAVAQMRAAFPDLRVGLYALAGASADRTLAVRAGVEWVRDWEEELRTAEVVIGHEWNPLELWARLLGWRRRWGFRLLLHDTHHRALTRPEALRALPLRELDGVLAFSESLRRVYEGWGVRRSYTLHEAADVEHFGPLEPGPGAEPEWDLAWIGNWGDEERTRELEQFLLEPARRLGARTLVHGVRYPAAARARLTAQGVAFGGYVANLEVPGVLARTRVAMHIPRRPYAGGLAGTPTIRVFEALACGAALACAPWDDCEGLFTAGEDYVQAGDADAMTGCVMQLLADPAQRSRLGRHGAATVRKRHTCGLRAQELEGICRDLG